MTVVKLKIINKLKSDTIYSCLLKKVWINTRVRTLWIANMKSHIKSLLTFLLSQLYSEILHCWMLSRWWWDVGSLLCLCQRSHWGHTPVDSLQSKSELSFELPLNVLNQSKTLCNCLELHSFVIEQQRHLPWASFNFVTPVFSLEMNSE